MFDHVSGIKCCVERLCLQAMPANRIPTTIKKTIMNIATSSPFISVHHFPFQSIKLVMSSPF